MRSSSGGAAYSGSLYSAYIESATACDRVQADQVGELERAHRVGAARSMPLSMSSRLAMPDSTIRMADEQVRDQQRVDDEAGTVLGADRVLAEHLLGEPLGAPMVSRAR